MSGGDEASGVGEWEDLSYLQQESGDDQPALDHFQSLFSQQEYFQPQTDSQPNTSNSSSVVSGSSVSQLSGIFHSIHLRPPQYVLPRNDYISLHPPNCSSHFENYAQFPSASGQYENDMRPGHDSDVAHSELEASLQNSYNSGPTSVGREAEVSLRRDSSSRLPEGSVSRTSTTTAAVCSGEGNLAQRNDGLQLHCSDETYKKTVAHSGEEGNVSDEIESFALLTPNTVCTVNMTTSSTDDEATELQQQVMNISEETLSSTSGYATEYCSGRDVPAEQLHQVSLMGYQTLPKIEEREPSQHFLSSIAEPLDQPLSPQPVVVLGDEVVPFLAAPGPPGEHEEEEVEGGNEDSH